MIHSASEALFPLAPTATLFLMVEGTLRLPRASSTALIVVGFFALSACIYGFTLPHTFVTLNDSQLVYQNPIVQSISPQTVKAAFTQFDPELYIPFTFLSYQWDWWIGQGSALVFHLDNLLLHTVNALLVLWLVYLLSKNRFIAFACGLVFLVHPINTEAVLWVSSRKDLLSTLFGRLTLIAYVHYVLRRRKSYQYLSIILFLFALLSKVKVIFHPFILLLIDWKEGRPWSLAVFTEKIPHFCLSILFGAVALYGKQEAIVTTSLVTKILLGVHSFALYLQNFLVPRDFSIFYPYLSRVSLSSPDFFIPVFLLLLFIGVAFLSLRWTKEIFFGCALYLVPIIPSFTNLPKGTDLFVGSDRYAYTALIGITYALATLAVLFVPRCNRKGMVPSTAPLWVVLAPLIILLGAFSYRQSLVWADSETLYRHAIAYEPDFYLSYYNLGVALDEAKKTKEAVTAYEHAMVLSPTYPLTQVNLGYDYYALGERKKARAMFDAALRSHPDFAMPHFDLGVMDNEEKNYDDAEREFMAAIQEEPAFTDARLNLISIEVNRGETQQAAQHMREALAYDAKDEKILALAKILVERGIMEGAAVPK